MVPKKIKKTKIDPAKLYSVNKSDNNIYLVYFVFSEFYLILSSTVQTDISNLLCSLALNTIPFLLYIYKNFSFIWESIKLSKSKNEKVLFCFMKSFFLIYFLSIFFLFLNIIALSIYKYDIIFLIYHARYIMIMNFFALSFKIYYTKFFIGKV